MKLKTILFVFTLSLFYSSTAAIEFGTDIDVSADFELSQPIGMLNRVSETGTGLGFKLIYNSYEKFSLNLKMSYFQSRATNYSDVNIIIVGITPGIQYFLQQSRDHSLYIRTGFSLISEEVKAEAGENYLFYGFVLGAGAAKRLRQRFFVYSDLDLVLIQDLNHVRLSAGVYYDFK